jgi:hypothetical protein
MKYNCGTCVQCWNGRELECECWKVPSQPMRFDTHPADMHPCEHGTAIVASAIAQPTFWVNAAGLVFADVEQHLTAFRDQCGRWSEWHETNKPGPNGILCGRLPWIRFDEAGLRLPTADELAQMYQQQGKDGQG